MDRIPFKIRQNSDSTLALHVEGYGSEPQIQFDRTLVEFAPVLPFATGSDAEVVIFNPTPYPIEIYSLEFDRQYVEEEEVRVLSIYGSYVLSSSSSSSLSIFFLQVLRWLKDYDRQNRLFLPPVIPGEKLPRELRDAFNKEHSKAKTEKQSQVAVSELLSSDTQAVSDNIADVEQPTSYVKLSSTDVLPQKVGMYVYDLSKGTPQPSTTALLSVPELAVIESVIALTYGTCGSREDLSQLDFSGLESSPVANAIARYLGIDLSPEAAIAEYRRGVAIVLHGPPSVGRTTQAQTLAEKYGACVLVVDDLLIDAISTASTPAGCKARECCIQAAQARAEVQDVPSSLSAPSKKQITGSLKDKEKEKDKEPVPEPPPPHPLTNQTFPVQPLEDSQFAVPEGNLLPCQLPQELIVEIISDRLQHTDCRRGVLFDGIDSRFAESPHMSTALILKAIGDRKHIYFVHLDMGLQAIKVRLEEIEKEKQRKAEEEVRQAEEAEERRREEIQALLDMEEEDYEALSEEQRAEIDRKRLEIKREKRLKKQQVKEEQERLEKEQREEEERIRMEEERLKKKGKGSVKDAKKASLKPGAVAVMGASRLQQTSKTDMTGSPQPLEHLQQASKIMGLTGSTASIMSGAETPVRRKGTLKATSKVSALTENLSHAVEESPLDKWYNYYNHYMESVKTLVDDWDRAGGIARTKKPAEAEEPPAPLVKLPMSSKKGKVGKQKESAQDQEVQVTSESMTDVAESREGVGVPLIVVDGALSVESITEMLYDGGNLPSAEEVSPNWKC